jgi:hypothetical protein
MLDMHRDSPFGGWGVRASCPRIILQDAINNIILCGLSSSASLEGGRVHWGMMQVCG